MGNSNRHPDNIDNFYMHIQLIGKDMTNFLSLLSGKVESSKAKQDSKDRKKIEDYWDFDYSKDKDITEQIDDYYQRLLDLKKENDPKKIKETLVFKVDNYSDKTVDYIFQKLNELREDYYMPILLFLVVNEKKEITYDKKKFPKIKQNLIFSKKYSEEPIYYKDDGYMRNLFIRFCSIHNELGDRFHIGEGENTISYDLIQDYYPFNLNICCVGRFGQGKSTGVNVILDEYKAKESSQGSAQTKYLTFYQATKAPIRILDIPGFDSDQNVKNAIEQLRFCSEEINKLEDYIHFFLYFISQKDIRTFSQYESPIIEEIIKYNDSKIIYVITHSEKDEDEEEEFINKINQGLYGLKDISEDKKKLVKQMMTASKDNVVFVNFYKEKKNEEFGKRELFSKIYDFFIESKFYKEASRNLSPKEIEKQAAILKERANSVLTWYKVEGTLIGAIPIIDRFIHKYLIKKEIVKKVGGIFGININFINEQNEKENKEVKNMKLPGNENKDENNIYAGADLNLEKDGDNLINDCENYKIGNHAKVAGNTGGILGGITLGIGFNKAKEASKITGMARRFISDTGAGKIAFGTFAFTIGTFIGMGAGAYITHHECNEIINKFEQFYKDNASKIYNSYLYAAEYLKLKAK